jgi:hypothetical protein
MQTRGVWIIELSELDSFSNSDMARIKALHEPNDGSVPATLWNAIGIATAMCLCRYGQPRHLSA